MPLGSRIGIMRIESSPTDAGSTSAPSRSRPSTPAETDPTPPTASELSHARCDISHPYRLLLVLAVGVRQPLPLHSHLRGRTVRRADRQHGAGADRQPPRRAVPALRLPGSRRLSDRRRQRGRSLRATSAARTAASGSRSPTRAISTGDRLLVDKNVFNLRNPRRWEMAVFRCPDPDPKEFGKPYVKRVVGLPGETITLIDGDVYANGRTPAQEPAGSARVARDRLRHDVTSPIPMDGTRAGSSSRPKRPDCRRRATAAREADDGDPRCPRRRRTRSALTYRHWNLDDKREEPVRAWSSYDGVPRSFGQTAARSRFLVGVRDRSGASERRCEFRVPAARRRRRGQRRGHGRRTRQRPGDSDPRRSRATLNPAHGVSLQPGRTHRFEFAFVDRRAILAIDGKVIFVGRSVAAFEARRGQSAAATRCARLPTQCPQPETLPRHALHAVRRTRHADARDAGPERVLHARRQQRQLARQSEMAATGRAGSRLHR